MRGRENKEVCAGRSDLRGPITPPVSAATLELYTIRPYPRFSISGTIRRVSKKGASVFVSHACLKCEGVQSQMSPVEPSVGPPFIPACRKADVDPPEGGNHRVVQRGHMLFRRQVSGERPDTRSGHAVFSAGRRDHGNGGGPAVVVERECLWLVMRGEALGGRCADTG